MSQPEPLVNALHAVQAPPATSCRRCRSGAPANGATVTGPVAIAANATNDHGITNVDFSVNGVPSGPTRTGPIEWTASWDASTVDQGGAQLRGEGDQRGRQTSTNRVTVVRPTYLQGSSVGKYGSDGYILGNWNGNDSDLASLPAGVTYSLTQGARATSVSPTTESGPRRPGRRAAAVATFYDLSRSR